MIYRVIPRGLFIMDSLLTDQEAIVGTYKLLSHSGEQGSKARNVLNYRILYSLLIHVFAML